MVISRSAIVKFILLLKLEFSKPQHKHLQSLVHGIILCEGRKNITQIRKAVRQDGELTAEFVDFPCNCSNCCNCLN